VRREGSAGFRRCFTKHGSSIDYGALGVTDADGMVEVFRRIALQKDESGHRILDMHHGFHPDITLIGDTEATGRWTLQFRQVDLHARTETVLSGEYDDHYVLEAVEYGREWGLASSNGRQPPSHRQSFAGGPLFPPASS